MVILNTGLESTFPIGELEVVSMLDTVVTLRSLFRAVVMFYFFITLAWLVSDLLDRIFSRRLRTGSHLIDDSVDGQPLFDRGTRYHLCCQRPGLQSLGIGLIGGGSFGWHRFWAARIGCKLY